MAERMAAQLLPRWNHTVKLLCPPPTRPPNKTPRYKVPAGTDVHICPVTSIDDWEPHTTRTDLAFERYERRDVEYDCYFFREKGFFLCVPSAKIIHREDLYRAGIVQG